MSHQYEVAERDGHTLDILTNPGANLRLIVSRHGAEPVSLSRRTANGRWVGFLWRDGETSPPAAGVWNGHCPVMGYFIHRLKDGRTDYRGHEVRGGTHSFLRTKTFCEPNAQIGTDGAASLTYTMTPAQYEPIEYPFRLTMRLTYFLEPTGIWRTRFHFESGEREVSTHVSFGLHPGFAVRSLAMAQVLAPPGTYRRWLAPGNFLSGAFEEWSHPGGPLPLDKSRLIDSYLLQPIGVENAVFTVDDPAGGRQSTIDCTQAPYVTIWGDGHDYICVEPCWGLPDAHDQVPFQHKLGIQEIPRAGSLERQFSVTPQVAAQS